MLAFDSSYFRVKSHFGNNDTQNCLVFQSIYRRFKIIIGVGNGSYISLWKSKGLSYESIRPPNTSDYSLTPEWNFFRTKARVKFSGTCLKQDKITYKHLWNK